MSLLRADALRLPLADESVDLVVTSPPYFGQRAYTDAGEVYDGQIGLEPHPAEFLDALWAVTAECWRVLKPSGSMCVNLGDKRSGSGGPGTTSGRGGAPQGGRTGMNGAYVTSAFGRAKSKQMLPHRFAIGCEDGRADPDGRGWVVRQELVWHKANGMPESVKDRCRDDFEMWFHLTKEGAYFSAVDELREPHSGDQSPSALSFARATAEGAVPGIAALQHRLDRPHVDDSHPLGRLPGSVWKIATDPLRWPAHLTDKDDNHYAAFPVEWPRRLILGWSPSGICTACGQGRGPVVDRSGATTGDNNEQSRNGTRSRNGYECACPDTSAPSRPAVVLDPFCGTGTTVAAARALGRFGVGVDLSAGYLRRAAWRITDPKTRAKVLRVDPPKPETPGQEPLFEVPR